MDTTLACAILQTVSLLFWNWRIKYNGFLLEKKKQSKTETESGRKTFLLNSMLRIRKITHEYIQFMNKMSQSFSSQHFFFSAFFLSSFFANYKRKFKNGAILNAPSFWWLYYSGGGFSQKWIESNSSEIFISSMSLTKIFQNEFVDFRVFSGTMDKLTECGAQMNSKIIFKNNMQIIKIIVEVVIVHKISENQPNWCLLDSKKSKKFCTVILSVASWILKPIEWFENEFLMEWQRENKS